MIDTQLQPALILWISTGTGIAADHVIRANQNGPDQEPDSLITFQLINTLLNNHEDYKKEADPEPGDISATHAVKATLTLSVNAYAPNGDQLLAQLWNRRLTYEGRRDLRAVKASNIGFSGVRDLTYKQDGTWRPRFQADFILDYRTLLVETNKTVDKLTLSGKIEDETLTVVAWDNT